MMDAKDQKRIAITERPSGDDSSEAVSFVAARKQLFAEASKNPKRLVHFPRAYSDLVDEYFQRRFASISHLLSPQNLLALIAMGGYGRRELCPHSDIDILIVYSDGLPAGAEEISRELFFPLWDAGLDLGHGVQDVAGCLHLAEGDLKALSTMFSLRCVAGDKEIAQRLNTGWRDLIKKKGVSVADQLAAEGQQNPRGYAASGFLLEPDLKRGPGGLRDFHRTLWLDQIMRRLSSKQRKRYSEAFRPEDRTFLAKDARFILTARTALHLAAGRKTDKLVFDYQPQVAEMIGTGARGIGEEVERFLSRLHRAMNRIIAGHDALIRWTQPLKARVVTAHLPAWVVLERDGLHFHQRISWVPDAEAFLELFEASAATNIPLSWHARRSIERVVTREPRLFLGNKTILSRVMAILSSGQGEAAGKAMLDTGFIGAVIPEFKKVEDYVQFDAYHLHPLGDHTLRAIRHLTSLRAEDWLPPGIWDSLGQDDIERLFLATLLHDVGKGAKDHALVGAKIAQSVLTEFDFDPETVEEAAFLVANHLLLVQTATRRDISDENIVAVFAGKIGRAGRLDALLLLTIADSMATGPKAWNPWARSLMLELYFKARRMLTSGILAGAETVQRMLETRDRVRTLTKKQIPSDYVERCLDLIPPRCTILLSPEEIVGHLTLVRDFEKAQADQADKENRHRVVLKASILSHGAGVKLILVAKDQPGLFAAMCGILSKHGISIQAADIFTWSQGLAVDQFVVLPPDLIDNEADLWETMRREMEMVLIQGQALNIVLEEPNGMFVRRKSPARKSIPVIRWDNVSSDFFTVLEVIADDRVGRLYSIAAVLSRMNVEIHRAKIATHGDRIADVFYLRTRDGEKITADKLIQGINSALMSSLTPAA